MNKPVKKDRPLLTAVVNIALAAGAKILDIYTQQAPLRIQMKPDNSPLTLADLAAHEIIEHGLSQLLPQVPILSEEGAQVSFAVRKNWHTFWLVDPLDGTQEFIHRSGQFTVNIALIEQGLPTLSVIFAPLKQAVYYAAADLGAYKKLATHQLPLRLQVRPWSIGHAITLVTTRKELHEELHASLSATNKLEITYRSSSLKFCLLAEGEGDIYLRKKPIHEWDTAAGQCILEQAGGVVLDSNYDTLRYNSKHHLLNPPFVALGDAQHLLPLLKIIPLF